MSESAQDADEALRAYFRKRTPEGQFLRYARARVVNLPMRIASIVFCFLGFLLIGDIELALGLAGAILAFDLLDSAILNRFRRRTSAGPYFFLWFGITSVTAGLQAAPIGVFAALLNALAGHEAQLFTIGVLMSAIFDAMLLGRMHRGAAGARLVVYAITMAAIFADADFSSSEGFRSTIFQAIGVTLFVSIIVVFLKLNERSRARNDARQQAVLASSQELAHNIQALRTSRELARRLGTVAERVSDAILVTDPAQTITWVNQAFTDLTGFTTEEVVNQPITILPTDASGDSVRSVFAAVDKGEQFRTEMVNQHKDGHKLWIDVGVTPIFDEAGAIESVIYVARDIGVAKKRERALAEAQEAAEQAMKAKHAFLATMSHEIRTPMNGVIGTADLLLETDLGDDQRTLVQTIANSGEALLTIVNDVLDLSALEAGRPGISDRPFDPSPILRSTLELVRPIAEAKGLALMGEIPAQDLPTVSGDAGRLRQILVNLLGNAIKFTVDGSVTMTVSPQPIENGICLSVAIRDTGIGIPPDKLQEIFESFRQADNSISGRFGGTGLGLSISRGLAEAMGGTLTATSAPGIGSTFTLAVPLPFASLAVDTAQSNRGSVPPQIDLTGRKVLVADDNRTNILLLEKMLAGLGFEIVIATNGKEAVELWDLHHPDLVLMDVRMPVMDGISATQAIRAQEQGDHLTPIIALTANAFPEDRQRCLAAGMTDFVSKPVRKRDLLDRVMAVLPRDQSALPPEPAPTLARG